MVDPVKETLEDFPVSQMEYDSSSDMIYTSAVQADLHFCLDWIDAISADEPPKPHRLLNIATLVFELYHSKARLTNPNPNRDEAMAINVCCW